MNSENRFSIGQALKFNGREDLAQIVRRNEIKGATIYYADFIKTDKFSGPCYCYTAGNECVILRNKKLMKDMRLYFKRTPSNVLS